VAFRRQKSAATGAKPNYPGFIEPGVAASINGSEGRALDTRDQVRRLSDSRTLANESGLHPARQWLG
jgi:hypothetical protein